MKLQLCPNFTKQQLFDEDYLLPIGQGVAEFKRGLKLHGVGSFLIDELAGGSTLHELYKRVIEEYDIAAKEQETVLQDVREFVDRLVQAGYLLADDQAWEQEAARAGVNTHYLKIGPLTVALTGPEDVIFDSLYDFETTQEEPFIDGEISLVAGQPHTGKNGSVLMRNEELILMETDEDYVFLLTGIAHIYELHASREGKRCICYYDAGADAAERRESVFHAIRFAFLLLAGQHGLYAIHSASLEYDGRAWLFSGPSGTGKSTHVSLWQEAYQTPVLNGDLNLLGFQDGIPVVYGIPWCGTSNMYVTTCIPLGGITFLRRSSNNYVEMPQTDEAALLMLNRIIYPVWTAASLARCSKFVERMVEKIRIFRLYCTKEPEAAAVMKEAIDGEWASE